jgi:hypothetical protein
MAKYGYRVIDGDGHPSGAGVDVTAVPSHPVPRLRAADHHRQTRRPTRADRRPVLDDPTRPRRRPSRRLRQRAGVDKYAGGSDPRARLTDIDTEGIDVAVLFATVAMGPLSGVLASGDIEFEAALCRAYNSWVAEYVGTDRARLKPAPCCPRGTSRPRWPS